MKHLSLKHSISKARDTYGYNIVTLTDTTTCKKYRTKGGGYDMIGTVFANWLKDNYSDELMDLCVTGYCGATRNNETREYKRNVNGFYGITAYIDNKENVLSYGINGACGLDGIVRIAKHIGLIIESVYSLDRKGRYKDMIGFNVCVNE